MQGLPQPTTYLIGLGEALCNLEMPALGALVSPWGIRTQCLKQKANHRSKIRWRPEGRAAVVERSEKSSVKENKCEL